MRDIKLNDKNVPVDAPDFTVRLAEEDGFFYIVEEHPDMVEVKYYYLHWLTSDGRLREKLSRMRFFYETGYIQYRHDDSDYWTDLPNDNIVYEEFISAYNNYVAEKFILGE
jgi:hypothetical protein